VITSAFEYVAPATLAEATAFLTSHQDDAKLLAGGHSLIPLMKLRLAAPKYLVDLSKVPGLRGIREVGGAIEIGAMTTHHEVETSAIVQQRLPALAATGGMVGDLQVRNRGTFGGSLAHADPAADYPALVLALNGEINAVGPKGQRVIKAMDFFVDLLTTSLGSDEIITSVRIPIPPAGTKMSYQKFPHPASRFAIVGVAAVIKLGSGGICESAAIGVTGAGSKAVRATAAESLLVGSNLDAGTVARAGDAAAAAVDPIGDIHASGEYRRHLVRELTARAVRAATSG
jgi:carbon-monoxide dehydrogenase medium subunit